MKNTYFFYKKEKINDNKTLFGCLAVVLADSIVDNFKFKFEIIEEDSKIEDVWPWFFTSKGIHNFDLEKIPYAVRTCVEENFFIEFNSYLSELKNNYSLPEYIMKREEDFLLLTNSEGEPLNQFEINIVRTLILIKISSFFMDHPELIFEFPLYLEYLATSKDDIEVEDFIEQILHATQKSVF